MEAPFPADDVDFRILRELVVDDLPVPTSHNVTLEEVAAALGLHVNTVSARLRRMTDAGFALPLVGFPDCNRLGIVGGRAFFPLPLPGRPYGRIPDIFAVEGTFSMYEFLDGWDVHVVARDAAALEAAAARLNDLIGAPSWTWQTRSERDWPRGPVQELGALERRVLAALLANARAPTTELAAELGLTARTVQRTADRLRKAGLLHVKPGGHLASGSGVLAYLHVEFADEAAGAAAMAPLRAHLPNSFLIVAVPRSQRFVLWAESLAALTDQAQAAGRIVGAGSVTLRLILRHSWNPAFPRHFRAILGADELPQGDAPLALGKRTRVMSRAR